MHFWSSKGDLCFQVLEINSCFLPLVTNRRRTWAAVRKKVSEKSLIRHTHTLTIFCLFCILFLPPLAPSGASFLEAIASKRRQSSSHVATRNKKLLGAPGIATRNKNATRSSSKWFLAPGTAGLGRDALCGLGASRAALDERRRRSPVLVRSKPFVPSVTSSFLLLVAMHLLLVASCSSSCS